MVNWQGAPRSLGNADGGQITPTVRSFGRAGSFPKRFFVAGVIDDACVFTTVPSLAAEVQQLYAYESERHSPASARRRPSRFQPRSQVGYWGKSVTFTVEAARWPRRCSYQWQKDGAPIEGATGSSLVLTNLQVTDAGNYSVVVTNDYGSTTSSNAYLTMNPAGVSLALYPGITIDGVVGLTYGIQYTTDLSNTNSWQGTGQRHAQQYRPMLWFDVQPANQPQRYYRVVPGPISIP